MNKFVIYIYIKVNNSIKNAFNDLIDIEINKT